MLAADNAYHRPRSDTFSVIGSRGLAAGIPDAERHVARASPCAILPLRRGAIAQLGERLNGIQAPLSAVARHSPITNETSGITQVIVCGRETITIRSRWADPGLIDGSFLVSWRIGLGPSIGHRTGDPVASPDSRAGPDGSAS